MNSPSNPYLTPSGKVMYWWNSTPAIAIAPRWLVLCHHVGSSTGTFERRNGSGVAEPAPSLRTPTGYVWTTEDNDPVHGPIERRVEHYQPAGSVQIGDLLFIRLYRDVAPEDICPILPIGELAVQATDGPARGADLVWMSRTRNAWLQSNYFARTGDSYVPMIASLPVQSLERAVSGDSGSPVFCGDFFVGFVMSAHADGFRMSRCHPDLTQYGLPPVSTPAPAPLPPPVPAPVTPPVTPAPAPALVPVPVPVPTPPEVPDVNGLVACDPDTTPALVAMGARKIPGTDLVKLLFLEFPKTLSADRIAEVIMSQTLDEYTTDQILRFRVKAGF
jgi:hypothetical protein